jgi:hypothetical protein
MPMIMTQIIVETHIKPMQQKMQQRQKSMDIRMTKRRMKDRSDILKVV